MPRRLKKEHIPESEERHEAEALEQPPSEINPYKILSLETSATPEQIKTAYRKGALRYHPDKASADEKDEAHKKFQEVAFAYAILSDEKRRRRYDSTGNTADSIDDEDFDWVDFFREQTQAMVSGEMIDQIKKEYQGSDEEKDDLLQSYENNEGDMDAIYEEIMCSNVLDDDERFRKMIDDAITSGTVEAYRKYAKESKASKKKRIKAAKGEEAEAMELAEELGVKDKLFGKSGATKKTKATDEDALKALIQSRQKDCASNFLASLEEKYGGSVKNSKRKTDEPPEETFRKNAKRSREHTR